MIFQRRKGSSSHSFPPSPTQSLSLSSCWRSEEMRSHWRSSQRRKGSSSSSLTNWNGRPSLTPKRWRFSWEKRPRRWERNILIALWVQGWWGERSHFLRCSSGRLSQDGVSTDMLIRTRENFWHILQPLKLRAWPCSFRHQWTWASRTALPTWRMRFASRTLSLGKQAHCLLSPVKVSICHQEHWLLSSFRCTD